MKEKRVFIALKVEADACLIKLINDLKISLKNEGIRWVDQKNIHLTIAFLGDRDEEEISIIKKLIQEQCNRLDPFSLEFENLGVFRNIKTPRVIWLGLKQPDKLIALAELIRKDLGRKDLFDENKAFKPHITIGRMKRIENRNLLADQLDLYHNRLITKQEFDKIILFESILKPAGAQYHILQTFPL